jgi:hypothetical protein
MYGKSQNGIYSLQSKKKEKKKWMKGAERKLKNRYNILFLKVIFKAIGGRKTLINMGTG